MENASKALIIAGAILLSILLISLGIMIYNQAQDTVNNSGMTEAQITSFNNKFLKYEGTAQKGSVVKSLINEVIATNSDESTPTISLDGDVATTGDVDTKKTYTVELSEYSTTGYVSTITITEN